MARVYQDRDGVQGTTKQVGRLSAASGGSRRSRDEKLRGLFGEITAATNRGGRVVLARASSDLVVLSGLCSLVCPNLSATTWQDDTDLNVSVVSVN